MCGNKGRDLRAFLCHQPGLGALSGHTYGPTRQAFPLLAKRRHHPCPAIGKLTGDVQDGRWRGESRNNKEGRKEVKGNTIQKAVRGENGKDICECVKRSCKSVGESVLTV